MPEKEPEAGKENQPATETAESADCEALKKNLAEEKAKADKYLANWQRSQADLANYKRRSQQEMEEAKNFANAMLLLDLMPFLDDMERAFSHIPPKLAEQEWVEGIKLVSRKLQAVLEKQGLLPIKALGEPFDPRLHEAVRNSKGKDGIVVTEDQKGYTFRDRVIRPSKVAVGNGEEE